MSKIVYLASPYTHPDPEVREENFRKVSKLAAEMNASGTVTLSPITYGHTLLEFKEMPHDWPFWKNFCISFLQHCDEIVVYKMPGWEKSNGVSEELKYAKENGIKISYVEYEEPEPSKGTDMYRKESETLSTVVAMYGKGIEKLSKVIDMYGNEIKAGDEVGVQLLSHPVPVYEKDGDLYFSPYDREERVRDYFSNDLYLL